MPSAFRRFFVLLLVALWVPATGHCSVRILSELLTGTCKEACSHGVSVAQEESCGEIERGDFTPASAVAHAPAPSLTALACLACLHARLLEEAKPLAPPAWASEHPRDWVPSWTFALRAAPLARAPDLT